MGFTGALVRRTTLGLTLCALGGQAIYMHSPEGEPPAYCSVFNHMVKAGGSTVKIALTKASRADGMARPGLCINRPGGEAACMDALYNSSVITGYAELLRYPLESAGRQCEYWTIMRHPIDRLISAFFYCPYDHDIQNRPDKWCGYRADPLPLEARLVEFAQSMWQNKAFWQMTFGSYCPASAFCEQTQPGPPLSVTEPKGWNVLQQIEVREYYKVILNVLSTYTAVGIMEEWDLTMDLFNARVKGPVRDWREQKQTNAGVNSEVRDKISAWAHRSPEIHKTMATDLLLYDFALAMFKKQTAESLSIV